MSAAERNSWMSPIREGGGEAGLVEVLLEAEQRVWSRGRSLGQGWADGKSGAPRQSGAGNGAGRNR
jgi:hypothetical protein